MEENQMKLILIVMRNILLLMIRQKHQDLLVNWTHFGDGPLDSILKEKIDSCNLSNFIVNAKGRVPNTCIIEFYKSSTFFLLTLFL